MFEFAWPWFFLLLPLPILVYWLLPAVKQQRNAALKHPLFNTLSPMVSARKNSATSSWAKLLLACLIWLLLITAIARPQWLGNPVQLPRAGRDIMLAVDLSGSMSARDMTLNGQQVTRLQLVKAVANKFIKAREGDRLGLILFGTHAYLQTPLTFDRKTVTQMLDDSSVGLAGPRTAIGDAMGLAIKRLMRYPSDNRILILLTDGGNNAGNVLPVDAAKIAKDEHVKVYTIGLGAERMTVNTFFGPQVVNPSADLDIKTLKEIAKMTGGLFFRASSGKDLQAVYQSINKLEPTKGNAATYRPITELYFWPLAAALLLLLLQLAIITTMQSNVGRDLRSKAQQKGISQ